MKDDSADYIAEFAEPSTDSLSPGQRRMRDSNGPQYLYDPRRDMPDPPMHLPIIGSTVPPYLEARPDDDAEIAAWRRATADRLRSRRDEARAEREAEAYADELGRQRSRRRAMRRLDEEEAAAATEPRVRRTAEEYAAIPRPPVIMQDVLPAAATLLGGPEAGGKSLLARDWGLCVATGTPWRDHKVVEPRNVVYVMDEGMHDFGDRWSVSPLWDAARDRIFVLDQPVNLLSSGDVAALIEEYDDVRPGMIIFDTIYGMGMPDDMGVKEVAPVINSLKRISQSWTACTLAIGHAGHNGERRFRGSSMWRQRTDVDWHMADLTLTCERSKIAAKSGLGGRYELEYPHLRFLDAMEAVSEEAKRRTLIRSDLDTVKNESDNARAKRLAPRLGIGDRQVRRLINEVRNGTESAAS